MKRLMCGLYVLLLSAAGVVALGAVESRMPEIPACVLPPRIDGSLDDAAWSTALTATDFVIIGQKEFISATNVTAYLMRDAAWLYVGFDVVHPQPLTIVPKFKQHDNPVQRENCVKVAFDPGTDGRLWYHFRLSAGNVRSEQRNSAKGGVELDWDIPWRSAARITDTGWQAEIALPFALLMDLGEPVKARINLLAHTFTPILDPYGVEIGQEREVASWAATPASWWTTPECFVSVAGLAEEMFKAPFLPMLENVQVGGYVFADGKYQYDLSGVIRNYSGRAGQLTLCVRDVPVAGAPGTVTQAIELEGGAEVEFKLPVPVRAVVRRNIQMEMMAVDGEVLDRVLIENPPVLDLFSAFLDRNYYTTEEQAGAVCRIGLPPDGLKNTRLAACLENGEQLGETADVKPLTEWSFSLANFETGTYPIRIELRQADGTLIADQILTLIKRAPKPGREWKIDRIRRVVLHDGKPYFAYGILFGGWNRAVFNEENYREIAEAGFNSVMYWAAPGAVEKTLSALNTVNEYNMHMVAIPLAFVGSQSAFVPELPDAINRWGGFTTLKGQLMRSKLTRPERSRIHADIFDQAVPMIRDGIKAVKDHPALMAYESFDEPLYDNYFDQYAEGRKLYRLIHEIDGYHPVRVLWGSGSPVYEDKYTDWSDIHARDPYWSPPAHSVRSSPNWVARETAELTARSKLDRKPVWQTPVLEMYSAHYKRHTLPAEQNAQTYLAILYECSGIFYFVYPAIHQMTWDMMRQLGREIQTIYPIITAPVPEHQVVYDGLDVDVVNRKMPDVHVALRRNPQGGFALLAVNSQPWPVQASFKVPFTRPDAPVRRQFGLKTFTLADGVFGETIEAFGRRVYLLNAVSDDSTALTVIVKQRALTEGYVPEETRERTARSSCKNIMPNPSFEENALPGFPDYWFVSSHSVPTFPNQRTGREKARYELDTDNSYHGKYSFRLRGTSRTYFKLCPQHDRPTQYVWSAWMRADREGAVAEFSGSGVKRGSTFKLTTEWQRYHIPVTMPKHASRHNSYALVFRADTPDARMWVDAMQFELGTAPTEFE